MRQAVLLDSHHEMGLLVFLHIHVVVEQRLVPHLQLQRPIAVLLVFRQHHLYMCHTVGVALQGQAVVHLAVGGRHHQHTFHSFAWMAVHTIRLVYQGGHMQRVAGSVYGTVMHQPRIALHLPFLRVPSIIHPHVYPIPVAGDAEVIVVGILFFHCHKSVCIANVSGYHAVFLAVCHRLAHYGATLVAVYQQLLSSPIVQGYHVGAFQFLVGRVFIPSRLWRGHQQVVAARQGRHHHQMALHLVRSVIAHLFHPLHHGLLCGIGQYFVDFAAVGEHRQVDSLQVAATHHMQRGLPRQGHGVPPVVGEYDMGRQYALLDYTASLGTGALGAKGYGAVAIAQGLYLVSILQCVGHLGIEEAPHRRGAAAPFVYGLTVQSHPYRVGRLFVIHIHKYLHPFQVQVYPQVVAIAGVEVDKFLHQPQLPLLRFKIPRIGFVEDMVSDYIEYRGGEAYPIVFPVFFHKHGQTLRRGAFQQLFVYQGRVVYPQEGVADGLFYGLQTGQCGAVAGAGAVVAVLLEVAARLGHIPGRRQQPLAAPVVYQSLAAHQTAVFALRHLEGRAVAALLHQAVHLFPPALRPRRQSRGQEKQKKEFFIHKKLS